MSGLRPETQRLIESAARYEELPSRERMGRVRSAVLRRAALGGVAAIASSTTLWGKASLLAASAAVQVATYAVAGALAGGVVIQVVAPGRPARLTAAAPVTTALGAPTAAAPQRLTRATTENVTPEAHGASTTAAASTPARDPAPATAMDSAAAELTRFRASSTEQPGGATAPATPTAPRAAATDARAPHESREGAQARAADLAPLAPALPLIAATTDPLKPLLDVLHQMRVDLAAQRSGDALSRFRESERLFRGSALEPEARAAYIAALCQQGRDDEALREGAALQQAFPTSHLARRLATGCAASPGRERTH